MVPSGTCSCHAAAGLRASPDGGHEEVDGSAGQEWAGFFCAAALHGCHGGEAGPVSAQRRTGLHQSAQQGEVLYTTMPRVCDFNLPEIINNTRLKMIKQNINISVWRIYLGAKWNRFASIQKIVLPSLEVLTLKLFHCFHFHRFTTHNIDHNWKRKNPYILNSSLVTAKESLCAFGRNVENTAYMNDQKCLTVNLKK